MLNDARLPDIPEWLRELYPFRTRSFQAGQYCMNFVDEGPADAPALVLLHGSPTWSFLFRKLIGQGMTERRIIAPDHVGFGLSDKPPDIGYHTLEQHVRNLTALLDALELRDITLVAHGWGGPIGLGYAVRHSANIARMVLCSTWALPAADPASVKLPLRMRIAKAGRLGAFLDSVLNLYVAAAVSALTIRQPSDWTVEGYKYPFPNMASRAATWAFLRKYLEISEQDRATMRATFAALGNIIAPVDILVGESDPLVTKLSTFQLRDALPNAHAPVFVADASHFLPEDAPDVLRDVVLREPSSKPESSNPASLFKILR